MNVELTQGGFQIGVLNIRFYAMMLLLGCLGGALLAHYEVKRRGMDPEHVWNVLALGVVLGLIGARLYHVIDLWGYYSQNLLEIPAIWHGGQGIYGAIVGAILAALIYARLRKLPGLLLLDIGAPSLLLGQAIGRWGNFFNQELYGPPTDLPWGIPIAPEHRLPGYEMYSHFHPLFLYESLLSFIGVAVLIWIARRFAHRLRPGDVMLGYIIWYPVERFLLEFLRIDPWKIAGIATAQWVSAACVLFAVIVLLWRHRTRKPEEQPVLSVPEPLPSDEEESQT